jgi:hypothetical protein
VSAVPGLQPRALLIVEASIGDVVTCHILDAPSNIREPEIRASSFGFPRTQVVRRLTGAAA